MKAGRAVKHPSNSRIEIQNKKSVFTFVSYYREKGAECISGKLSFRIRKL